MTFDTALAFLQQPQIAIPIVAATVAVIFLMKRPWTALYVGLMPLINWAFAGIDTIAIPENLGGGAWHPFTVVTGLVLVARDFAQREIKHWILGAMVVGLALSTLTAWPVIVVASGVAFLISETADWAVYTFTKRPLSRRILISSAIGAPIDQIAFIGLASLVVPGIFAWGTILTGIVSKLIGAYIVSRIVARQERRAAQIEMNPA
jgi:queuosine precursor transporter